MSNHCLILNKEGIPRTYENRHFDKVYRFYIQATLNGESFKSEKGETKRLVYGHFTADCRDQFPLTTLRRLDWKKVYDEYLFDIGFSGNVKDLGTAKNFWSFLADKDGNLGAACYNRQWRRWPAYNPAFEEKNEKLVTEGTTDQFEITLSKLLKNPLDRTAFVITANPAVWENKCHPCHIAMIFSSDGEFLDVQVPSRSQDLIIGFPIDVARYALILHRFAMGANLKPRFVHIPHSNVHIYDINYDDALELVRRSPTSQPQYSNGEIYNYSPNSILKVKLQK